ncbi:hypothetical protein [Chitinophaga sp. sic0106]|uniref:hypothetical protein n=1 Tax=Chitinophaga sp. sic0106 TaxID=2854785 RepID=UPI001C47E963|nr:hypothetical protein [Chitinophaga sp. sic0106]MBV7528996.1 hypothetical protein [Chitinophaga sp. sic0106]
MGTPVANDNEISVRELFNLLGSWVTAVKRNYIFLLIAILLGGVLGVTYAKFKKKEYIADLTFVMEDSKTNSLGSISGLASQLGFNLGSGGESGVFSGENIIAFLGTRLMVEKTLLTGVAVDGKKISLAELYVDTYQLRQKWDKDPTLKNIQFPIGQDRGNFTRKQDSLLFEIYKSINEKNLTVIKPDKKFGFILARCISRSEDFSKAFIEKLVYEAIEFYVKTKVSRSKDNVDKLQAKADSLELMLNKKTYSTAVAQDLNVNPAKRIAMVGSELQMRDKIILQTMYGEVVKNLEISKMSLLQETPIIQIVDKPITPLPINKVSVLKSIMIGGMLAAFLVIGITILRTVIKQYPH